VYSPYPSHPQWITHGLSGADQRCQSLAKEAGAGDRTWRAYLSTSGGAANARTRRPDDAASRSWNSSHPSRGCGQQDLVGTGGAGHFYCLAAD